MDCAKKFCISFEFGRVLRTKLKSLINDQERNYFLLHKITIPNDPFTRGKSKTLFNYFFHVEKRDWTVLSRTDHWDKDPIGG